MVEDVTKSKIVYNIATSGHSTGISVLVTHTHILNGILVHTLQLAETCKTRSNVVASIELKKKKSKEINNAGALQKDGGGGGGSNNQKEWHRAT